MALNSIVSPNFLGGAHSQTTKSIENVSLKMTRFIKQCTLKIDGNDYNVLQNEKFQNALMGTSFLCIPATLHHCLAVTLNIILRYSYTVRSRSPGFILWDLMTSHSVFRCTWLIRCLCLRDKKVCFSNNIT